MNFFLVGAGESFVAEERPFNGQGEVLAALDVSRDIGPFDVSVGLASIRLSVFGIVQIARGGR